MSKPYVVGVISDSHIPHRLKAMPHSVLRWLDGSDLILHAGDIEDPRVLDQLGVIAPTLAVRGNVHWQTASGVTDQDLPLSRLIKIQPHGRERVIWMSHGHLNFGFLLMDKMLLKGLSGNIGRINTRILPRLARARPKEAEVVVFGHSHYPMAKTIDGALFFNPGAVVGATNLKVKPSMGRLVFHEDGRIEPMWSEV